MNLIDTIRNAIPPVHREGYPFIAAFAVLTLILGWIWDPLFYIGLALTVWCALFFRDPKRVTPVSDDLVISPADGKFRMSEKSFRPRNWVWAMRRCCAFRCS